MFTLTHMFSFRVRKIFKRGGQKHTRFISVKVINDLNDIKETSNLVENLKQILYEAYKDAYDEDRNQKNKEM
jgi:hypothetical protein